MLANSNNIKHNNLSKTSLLSSSQSSTSLSYNPDNEGRETDSSVNTLWNIHESLDILRDTMSSQRLVDGDNIPDEINDLHTLPPTYIVLHIRPKVHETTIKWLVEKIRGKRRDGGAELIIMRQPYKPDEGFVFHISASRIKFLETAEEMEMIKEDSSGQMREFTVAQLEDFLQDNMHEDDLLTMSERQTIVRHELENIRALPEETHIPGYTTYTLYEGQSILQVCEKWNIIKKCYPLHDEDELKKLGANWYQRLFAKQPIEEIRMYFGESIALYFTFLGFYTSALLIPMFLGFLQLLLVSVETIPFFCIFNVVWVTVFLEVWKRRSNALAFKWGTITMTSLDEPRPNFRGTMGIDAVSGKIQPQNTRYFTYLKMYGVSFPIVFLCLIGAFLLMLLSFWAEDFLKQLNEYYQQFVIVPSIIYSILVFIVNMYYRKLATFLTEWENHRTQSQYDRHRVTKLVLFEFVNNFMSLFYIAFIIRDMDMLRNQLQIMLIISQAINNLQEAILPLALKYLKDSTEKLSIKSYRKNQALIMEPKLFKEIKLPEINSDDTRIRCANIEGEMEDYEGTYDDYLELFIQFGYVFLFSSVYPVAAFWAVLNNVLEIRADAFKLCKIYQRPMCRKVKDIGAWQRVFEVLGALSIVTNCGLLYLSPQIRKAGMMLTDVEWLLVFVFLEHVLLGIRYLLHITISDKPEWVRVALAKRNYESKQALKLLKMEKLQRNRKLLTRKFKTIHGTHSH